MNRILILVLVTVGFIANSAPLTFRQRIIASGFDCASAVLNLKNKLDAETIRIHKQGINGQKAEVLKKEISLGVDGNSCRDNTNNNSLAEGAIIYTLIPRAFR